jgi:hypothetical protein
MAITVTHDQNDQATGVLLFDSTTMSWTYESGGSGGDAAAIALTGDRILTTGAGDPAAELNVSTLQIRT